MHQNNFFICILWAVFILCIVEIGFAQESALEASMEVEKLTRFGIGVESHFNANDIFFGFSAFRRVIPEKRISLVTSFYIRPHKKKILVNEGENIYYIFRARRYLFLLGGEKEIRITKGLGLFASVLAGVDKSIYYGSNRGTFNFAAPVLNTGLVLGDNFQCRLGYQYIDLPRNKNRFFCSINGFF